MALSPKGNNVQAMLVDTTYGTTRTLGQLFALAGPQDAVLDLLYMKDTIVACSTSEGTSSKGEQKEEGSFVLLCSSVTVCSGLCVVCGLLLMCALQF